MGKKRNKEAKGQDKASKNQEEPAPPAVILSEDKENEETSTKWINKQRVLVFGCRGMSHRDRHLMEDLKTLMPHSKSDSKMNRKKDGGGGSGLFAVNEIAEMKNANKVVLFESRRRRDLYLWLANVHGGRGPSAKFVVENVHTMAELKMTGNCLKGSRPLLSFDKSFGETAHLKLLKELFGQIFGVPNRHPKSQPFFDRVYAFSVADGKIWFRHYQIVEEDGSLAEIGPRFVLNPVKIFESSFSGATLWENPDYVSPAATRAAFKRLKAGKYRQNVTQKAAREANRPTGPTYKVDQTDDVFQTIEPPRKKSKPE